MAVASVSEMGAAVSEPCAIRATFSTWRPVNGRKVLQLVFEVPIEQQGEVLTMLGAPDDKWCAIALLKEKPEPPVELAPAAQHPSAGWRSGKVADKPKGKFSDLSLPAQAGIRCDEPDFHKYLSTRFGHVGKIITDPAVFVREYCDVPSRANIAPGTRAAEKWRRLEDGYQRWLTDSKYAGAQR